MSAGLYWTTWHLTPGGWVRGSVRSALGRLERATPPDSVMTTEFYEERTPTGVIFKSNVLQTSPQAAIVAALVAQYGPPPEEL